MPFHENEFDRIKTKKPIILVFDLLSTNYVGFNIVRDRKSASVGKK